MASTAWMNRRSSVAQETGDHEALKPALEFISAEFEAKTFPGAVLAVEHGGRNVLERYWGTYAGPESPSTPYTSDVFNLLFSFSKVLSATVVVMAHQDGLLEYDKPLSTYIPEFKGGGKDAITLRHALTHSAGLTTTPLEPVLSEDQWNKAIADLCAVEVEWEPGSKTAYHAISGLLLAAEAVRRVSDRKPWADICRDRLFAPLGADGLTFGLPPEGSRVALTPPPKSYPCPIDTEHVPFVGHPSGGAFGRVGDMLKFLRLHLNRGVWNGKVLVQPNAFEEMHRVQYAEPIAAAKAAGKPPNHEYWALGFLTRGDTQEGWFGFGNVASEQAYGHAGIDTVIGIADPTRDVAMVFITTASPGEASTTMRLRNTVTNKVMAAFT